MRTIEQIVSQEVHYCVSGLVHTLANRNELDLLTEQACDLCSPILDYEEAALQAGWLAGDTHGEYVNSNGDETTADSWEYLCYDEGVDPYEREIFEHWIVSDWLAEKLAEKGERIDTDFAGITVWGRTTTGQAISMDSVIAEIYADLMTPRVYDYEAAARAIGWTIGTAPNGEQAFIAGEDHQDAGLVSAAPVGDWQDLCRREHLWPFNAEGK